LIKPALKTGNLTMITYAMAREVLTDPATGLATGVSYVSTLDMQEHTVRGKIVILAASAGETARLLLNSKSARFPQGLANSSGIVGRYINDSTGASRSAIIPTLFDRKRYNEDGVGGMHVYTPWWGDNKNSISLVGITSNIGAVWVCQLMASVGVSKVSTVASYSRRYY
jgi:choline dehydrogenase-like flavoprotein